MASNRALLVAINNYGSQQNNLPSCLEDAARFRSLLEERYGFDQFKELYDGDATVANVEQGLTWLFEDVAPDDRLVFFYSGHGYQQPKGENLEECLVLSNMKFLFDDRLSELSQTAPPGVLTVVLDSCFSGGMEKQVGADGRIEIARTKAWMPPANARSQQQKALIGRQLIPRPFGSQQVTNPAGVKRAGPGAAKRPEQGRRRCRAAGRGRRGRGRNRPTRAQWPAALRLLRERDGVGLDLVDRRHVGLHLRADGRARCRAGRGSRLPSSTSGPVPSFRSWASGSRRC